MRIAKKMLLFAANFDLFCNSSSPLNFSYPAEPVRENHMWNFGKLFEEVGILYASICWRVGKKFERRPSLPPGLLMQLLRI